MSAKIVIVNGSGRTGKDTFCNMCQKITHCAVYSSVAVVKELAAAAGWDGKKTEKDRKFLSDLKDLLTAYNDLPLRSMKEFVMGNADKFDIIFLMIREPEEIRRAVEEFNAITLLVKRHDAEVITGNHADRDVELFNYDYTVYNNGTLDDLRNLADTFVKCIHSTWFEKQKMKEKS